MGSAKGHTLIYCGVACSILAEDVQMGLQLHRCLCGGNHADACTQIRKVSDQRVKGITVSTRRNRRKLSTQQTVTRER